MTAVTELDKWHELLSARYVCEACMTRYFQAYRICPACHKAGTIRPFLSMLMTVAYSEEELRAMIAQGQRILREVEAAAPEAMTDPSPVASEPGPVEVSFEEYLPSRPTAPPEGATAPKSDFEI